MGWRRAGPAAVGLSASLRLPGWCWWAGVAGRVAPGALGGRRWGAVAGRARSQALKRVGEVLGPAPVDGQPQGGGAGVKDEAAGDVQQPVAQALGLGGRQLAAEQQPLGPGDQVMGEAHELQPDAVVLEVSERQVAQAGVSGALSLPMWSSTRARAR